MVKRQRERVNGMERNAGVGCEGMEGERRGLREHVSPGKLAQVLDMR